ncbi:FAD-dependent monooxygenase [Paracrocinitomix mangrovi]|uniref:FAD-dependent monooxygenase n=1 Tax=Paracrocinitomix mangrovi TaxID=2862509 RepID=UPI001C8EF8AE|nr:FAD-dependent monooxygenase [Paracrocinitomix mangrovi]UKN02485.1 FAD-dependent monooxygenase [Paracrocinitomix mangrovi]
MKTFDYDIIVIGAGVAGGVFAASQNKDKKILVIERDLTEPDRIIGELMQPRGLQALEEMGLAHLVEGFDAQVVEGYKLIKGDETFTIHYKDVDNGIKGIGLRNGKFLTAIRNDIKSKENIDLVEGNVTDLIEENNVVTGVSYTNAQGEECKSSAAMVVVCDGPMSFFRSKLSKPNKKVTSYFMGLVLRDLDLEHPSLGHMIVTGDAPVLVYPIHSNGYRILIDYPGEKPPRIGTKAIEKFKEEISAVLPKEMVPSFVNAIENDQLKVMPNHSMKAQAFRKKGVVLLGDSLNMRHPLTGGGMTATFNDIISLNKALDGVDVHNSEALEKAVESYYENRSEEVETINILANALYKVFRDADLKEACFEYLQKGGEQSTGPLSILAGINRNKKYLLKHFFKVAMQHPLHFVTKPKKQMRLYKNAVGIIRPILKDEDQPAIV